MAVLVIVRLHVPLILLLVGGGLSLVPALLDLAELTPPSTQLLGHLANAGHALGQVGADFGAELGREEEEGCLRSFWRIWILLNLSISLSFLVIFTFNFKIRKPI